MENPLGKREQFWDEFLQKYADMAVDGVVAEGEDYNEDLQQQGIADVVPNDVSTPAEKEAEQKALKSIQEKEKQKQMERDNANQEENTEEEVHQEL